MEGVRILEDDKQQNRLIGPLSKKKGKKRLVQKENKRITTAYTHSYYQLFPPYGEEERKFFQDRHWGRLGLVLGRLQQTDAAGRLPSADQNAAGAGKTEGVPKMPISL